MTDTAKRVLGPVALGTGDNSAQYTTPGSTTFICRHIHVFNPSTSAVTLTGAIGTTATAANRFYDAISIPPGESLDWSGFMVLATTETLSFKAGTATQLTLVVSGVEVT